jgi:hypothetical protein
VEATQDFSDAIRGLIEWVSDRQFGSVTVQKAFASVDRDAEDEVALFLTLTLSDPVDQPTWPIQDVLALRHGVLERASELQLTTPVYVRLTPSTDTPQADDRAPRTGT